MAMSTYTHVAFCIIELIDESIVFSDGWKLCT